MSMGFGMRTSLESHNSVSSGSRPDSPIKFKDDDEEFVQEAMI